MPSVARCVTAQLQFNTEAPTMTRFLANRILKPKHSRDS